MKKKQREMLQMTMLGLLWELLSYKRKATEMLVKERRTTKHTQAEHQTDYQLRKKTAL